MIDINDIERYKIEEDKRNKRIMASPDSKIVVGYHANCVDGITSAAVFNIFAPTLYFKNKDIEIANISVQYGDNYEKLIPVNPEEVELFLLDFSFPPKIMAELCKKFKKVHNWDHHISNINKLKDNEDIKEVNNFFPVFDLNKSGASLTLDTLIHSVIARDITPNKNGSELEKLAYNEVTCKSLDLYKFLVSMEHIYNEYLLSDIFKFVQIVESGDLYTFEEAYSKEIGSYLKLFYRNISISHASEILVNLKSKDFSYMQEKGESFLLKQDAEFFFKVNAISKSVQSNKLPLIKLNGVPVLCINYTGNVSDFGNTICRTVGVPVCMYWFMDKFDNGNVTTSVIASLRSMDHLPSINDVAESFGGGGHRNAAGFELSSSNPNFDEEFSKIFGSNANKVFLKDLEK